MSGEGAYRTSLPRRAGLHSAGGRDDLSAQDGSLPPPAVAITPELSIIR